MKTDKNNIGDSPSNGSESRSRKKASEIAAQDLLLFDHDLLNDPIEAPINPMLQNIDEDDDDDLSQVTVVTRDRTE